MTNLQKYNKLLEGRDKREAQKDPWRRLYKARTKRLEEAFLAEEIADYGMIEDVEAYEEAGFIIN